MNATDDAPTGTRPLVNSRTGRGHRIESQDPLLSLAEHPALVFPGQGSQYVGMGRDIYDSSPAGRAVFEEADRLLKFPLTELCFEGPDDELEDTINAQPAILTVSVAALESLRERMAQMGRRLEPVCVAGHSLGEYSALVAANAIDFADALPLVRERGRLMKETGKKFPGGMAAIMGLDLAVLENIVARAREAGEVALANLNAPAQTVISGEVAALQRAIELARAEGARRVAMLRVSIASHSPLMNRASQGLSEALAHVHLRDPEIPVIANISGQALHTADEIRRELVENVVRPVNWTRSVREMVNGGGRTFVEVGPGKVLSGLIKRISVDVKTVNVQDFLSDHLPLPARPREKP